MRSLTEASLARTLVVAEIGINLNGKMVQAVELIKAAASCGADVAKFQFFDPNALVRDSTPVAEYQRPTSRSRRMRDLLAEFALSKSHIQALKESCDEVGIGFSVSIFSHLDVSWLAELNPQFLKIPSGEIINVPLLESARSSGIPVVVSTGMSNEMEVDNVVRIFQSEPDSFKRLALLHCTSSYPAPLGELNLRVIPRWISRYGCPIGYSDHSIEGITSPIAVALGATIIEKHLTLNRFQPGPDHSSSFDPIQFENLVTQIRLAESLLGTDEKAVQPCETQNRYLARQSIVAVRDLESGHILRDGDISSSRPSDGIGVEHWNKVVGARTVKRLAAGATLQPGDIA